MSNDRSGHDPSAWSEMGRYAHLGFQLVLSMGLFLLGGWWLDGKIGTTPLFTIVGAMLGAAAAFYNMMRQLLGKPRSDSEADPGGQERKR